MRNKILFFMVILLLGLGLSLVYSPRDLVVPKIPQLATMSKQIGTWNGIRDTVFNTPTLDILRPTDYLMRTYINSQGIPLSLYIGYHDGSPSSGPIHSPKNCLPGGGWEFKSIENVDMDALDSNVNIVRAVLTKAGQDMTFYYWYQVRGEIVTSDLDMKIAEFMGVLTDKRKDAAFVRIGLTMENKEEELQIMQDFFKNAYPLLKAHLPS